MFSAVNCHAFHHGYRFLIEQSIPHPNFHPTTVIWEKLMSCWGRKSLGNHWTFLSHIRGIPGSEGEIALRNTMQFIKFLSLKNRCKIRCAFSEKWKLLSSVWWENRFLVFGLLMKNVSGISENRLETPFLMAHGLFSLPRRFLPFFLWFAKSAGTSSNARSVITCS